MSYAKVDCSHFNPDAKRLKSCLDYVTSIGENSEKKVQDTTTT